MSGNWKHYPVKVTKLTEHEIRIITLIAQGNSYMETAVELGLSKQAVTTTLARARRKLGARNSTHAAVIAVRSNLL